MKKWLKISAVIAVILFIGLNLVMQMQGSIKQNKYDYILILGTQLDGEKPSSMLDERVRRGYINYTLGLADKIIASGAQASNEAISEAQAIKNRLIELGVRPEDVLIEDDSTRTIENIKYSFEKYGGSDTTMLVVSNQYHLLRVNLIANQLDVKIDTDGASTPDEFVVKYYAREYAALIKFTLEKVGIING